MGCLSCAAGGEGGAAVSGLTDERLARLERVAAAFVRLRAGQVADRPCHGTRTRLRYAEDMQAALRRLREQTAEIEQLREVLKTQDEIVKYQAQELCGMRGALNIIKSSWAAPPRQNKDTTP